MIQLWEIPLILFYLVLAYFAIQKISFFKLDGIHNGFVSVIFLLKVTAGTFLALIYVYYYTDRSTADVFKYFDDSKYMSDALWSKPGDFFRMLFGFDNDNEYFNTNYYNHMNNWFRKYESNIYNDSHTIIRINALMRIFSFGSYHVHTIFACFLSLIGLVALYKSFVKFAADKRKLIAMLSFLLPSVVFWSSGVLKESFLVFGLGLFFYVFILIIEKKWNWKLLGIGMIVFVLLLYLKVYVLMALLPGFIGFYWVKRTNYTFIVLKYLTIILISIFGAIFFEYFFPKYHMLEIFVQKQQDFIRLSEAMNSGSRIDLVPLENNWCSFLIAAPSAFFTVLLRPFIWESTSPLMVLAALENLVIVGLIVFAVIKFKKPEKEQLNLIYLSLTFVVLLFILIGWVTPVLGAIVRYKVPALPFLVLIPVILMDQKKGKS